MQYRTRREQYDFPLDIFSKSEMIIPVPEEMTLFDELRNSFGRGESEAIAIAKNRGLVFITNDRKAYQVAEKEGVDVYNLYSLMSVLYIQKTLTKEEIIDFFEELKIKDKFKVSDDYLDKIFGEE